MQRSLRSLNAPVDLAGLATLRWSAPILTASYALKVVTAITQKLHADLEPLLASLDTLNVLLPILTTAKERGALSADGTDALVTTINDLARAVSLASTRQSIQRHSH